MDRQIDWIKVTALCTAGLLVCGAIPVGFQVWDRIFPPGQQGRATMSGNWGWVVLAVAVLLGVALNLVAAFIVKGKKDSIVHQSSESTRLIELRDDLDVVKRDRDTAQTNLKNCWAAQKKTLKELDECNSHLNHWKKEVDRVRISFDGQKETIEKAWKESESRVSNLEQQLRVAQDKVDGLTVPRGRLRIRKAEYSIPGKVGLDVTETLERMILDERLDLDVLYNDIFRPDPWKRIPKQLTIEFTHGLKEFSVTVLENTRITLPFPYGIKEAT